jgi:calcium-dependent protein kinase
MGNMGSSGSQVSGKTSTSSKSPKRESMTDLEKVEKKSGKIAVSGRYHRHPKVMSQDYDVKDKALGSGMNGEVKMAVSKQQPSGQKYAMKAFKFANVAVDKKVLLESEVEVFLCMDHPHVTRLYDVYEEDGFLYLIMECMEGGELFDRVIELKTFKEKDAAGSVNQMLLAVNYIHSHGIVHRDLKLENFLYDRKGSNHLKLIDFGFSKMWDPNVKMQASCGTLAYVAPEVLQKSYTSKCDLWSLGVITFILLAGYMPFSGSDQQQTRNIMEGKFKMKPERWDKISKEGRDFTLGLMQKNAAERLSAEQALAHTWIKDRDHTKYEIDHGVADALREFGKATKFRRCCMEMMAWSLSNEERAQVRDAFIAMDENKKGTITLLELKKVLQDQFHVPNEEIQNIFQALDQNHDDEIHYSDFLAAMVGARINMHDDHLRSAFRKFDVDNSGYITKENLREVLGDTYEGETVDNLLAEADLLQDGRISYQEFVSYLTGQAMESHADAAAKIVDEELKKSGGVDSRAATPMRSKLMPKFR